MQTHPSFSEFQKLAQGVGIVPVWREFLFDTETAVTAYEKLAQPPFGFLLESVVGGEQWARYSFLGSQPREAWRLKGEKVSVFVVERTHQLQLLHERVSQELARYFSFEIDGAAVKR